MKKIFLSLTCVLCGCIFLSAACVTAEAQQRQLSSKLIRLHIIANSDLEEDQNLKLCVRDAVQTYLGTQQWADREEALQFICGNMQAICDLAANVAEEKGQPCAVKAEFGYEQYPTRNYEKFTLPPGEYLSLKIILGEGGGKNWWCVVYPSFCTPATSADFSEIATSAGLNDREILLITESTPEVKIKFRLLELAGSLRKTLQDT